MAQSQIQAMQQILTDQTTQMQNIGGIVSDLQAAFARAQQEIHTANQNIDLLAQRLDHEGCRDSPEKEGRQRRR